MKIKIVDLQPNPFKKYIQKGNLNEEKLEVLRESIEHGTLPEQFYARKNNGGTWELVFGHHRLKALEEKKGRNYQVDVIEVDYSDEQMLVDMIRENITAAGISSNVHERADEFDTVRQWLLSDSSNVKQFNKTLSSRGRLGEGRPKETDSYRSIADFISKEGKAVSYVTVKNYLDFKDKLAPDLFERVGKASHAPGEKEGDEIPMKDALHLSKFEDFKEQRELADALLNSREQHGNLKAKNITMYKSAPIEIKQLVRERKIDIADISEYIKTIEPEPELAELTEEERNLHEEMEEERIQREKELEKPEVKEQARLIRSWLAHCKVQLKNITCPKCGKDFHNLRWNCCDLNVEESRKFLTKKLNKKR